MTLRIAGRPPAVVAGIVLFGAVWLGTSAVAIASGAYGPGPLAGMAFWYAVLALLLYRAWAGGPFAIMAIHRIGISFGILILIALVGVLALYPDEIGETLRRGVPGLVGAAALMTSGFLMGREDVTRWRADRNRSRSSR
ncbi:hypothetical protein [Actinomadura hibisca]|uniref:hypothetical protein n=1 Tax=Actinomadura hibisca TaxID=68565 RepID=UPI00082C64F2|nr:hypothetical protein [Actinomadura hibisca]